MSPEAPAEDEAFDRLKAELDLAFSQPDDSYSALDIEAVIARNRRRHDPRPSARGHTPP